MADASDEDGVPSRAEDVVFWSWIGVLAVGLAYMLILPLTGR